MQRSNEDIGMSTKTVKKYTTYKVSMQTCQELFDEGHISFSVFTHLDSYVVYGVI